MVQHRMVNGAMGRTLGCGGQRRGDAEWNAEWCDGKTASRGRYRIGWARRRNGDKDNGKNAGLQQLQEQEAMARRRRMVPCRMVKNAGRGRYRMGEARRNGAMARTLGCGRYSNRTRWRGEETQNGTQNGATGRRQVVAGTG
jgi:hypothetical protein